MENHRPYWQVCISLIFSLLATAAVIVIGIRAIAFLMPFVIGWLIASIAYPLVNWLERRLKIVKRLGTAILVIIVIAGIVIGIYFGISRISFELLGFIHDFPNLYAQLEDGLRKIGSDLSGIFQTLPQGIQDGWKAVVEDLDQYMADVISKISQPTMSAASRFAKRVPSYLISIFVSLLSAYFFTVEREEVIAWFYKISPPAIEKRMTLVMENLRYAVGGYLKAQFKIMGIVFLILGIGFFILGIHYFVLVALLIAILDFLPFFGTGTAMIPWAIYTFFMGDYRKVIGLVIIYVISQVARQLLQPKLVGDSMGMNPLVTLLLLYVGYKFSSVLGMILAVPIGLVIIKMCEAGAFDYILDDVKILVEGILKLRENRR